jgi:hypothetical protein
MIKIFKHNFNLVRKCLIIPISINNNRCYSTNEHQQKQDSSSSGSTNTKSSVDEEEMRRFKGLSHSWWIEDGGEFEALHKMNKLIDFF